MMGIDDGMWYASIVVLIVWRVDVVCILPLSSMRLRRKHRVYLAGIEWLGRIESCGFYVAVKTGLNNGCCSERDVYERGEDDDLRNE